jgi:hypothetical protein
MFTADHASGYVTTVEQVGALRLDPVVSEQPSATLREDPTEVNALFVILSEASPTRARLFALSMHERLCERGDVDHADVWEAWLRLCENPALQNDP